MQFLGPGEGGWETNRVYYGGLENNQYGPR